MRSPGGEGAVAQAAVVQAGGKDGLRRGQSIA